MLGVILLYVGMVLMSNGLHRLEGCSPCSDGICPQAQICQMSGTAFRQSQYSAAFHARP